MMPIPVGHRPSRGDRRVRRALPQQTVQFPARANIQRRNEPALGRLIVGRLIRIRKQHAQWRGCLEPQRHRCRRVGSHVQVGQLHERRRAVERRRRRRTAGQRTGRAERHVVVSTVVVALVGQVDTRSGRGTGGFGQRPERFRAGIHGLVVILRTGRVPVRGASAGDVDWRAHLRQLVAGVAVRPRQHRRRITRSPRVSGHRRHMRVGRTGRCRPSQMQCAARRARCRGDNMPARPGIGDGPAVGISHRRDSVRPRAQWLRERVGGVVLIDQFVPTASDRGERREPTRRRRERRPSAFFPKPTVDPPG